MQEASDLWLELFMHLSDLMSPEKTDYVSRSNDRAWIEHAAEMADFALELYETRWPHMGHKGK